MNGIRKVVNRRKATDLVSVVLLLALASLMASTVFADVPLAHQHVIPIYGNLKKNVFKTNAKECKIVSMEIMESNTIIPISGTLNPYTGHLWYLGYLLKGSLVEVIISWSPGTSTLFIGLCLLTDGWDCRGSMVTGGSAHLDFECWADGYYAVCIINYSSAVVTYSGYIRIIYAK